MYQQIVAMGTVDVVMPVPDTGGVQFLLAIRRIFKDNKGEIKTDISKVEIIASKESVQENSLPFIKTGIRVLVRGIVLGDANGNPEIFLGVDDKPWSRMTIAAYSVKVTGVAVEGMPMEDELFWTLCGRLGRDPEMRYTPEGLAVTNFSVAVEYYTKAAGTQKLWVRCAAWGVNAENINTHLTKGKGVLLDARPLFEGGFWKIYPKRDGTPGAAFEATVAHSRFIDRRDPVDTTPQQQIMVEDEEIPFD